MSLLHRELLCCINASRKWKRGISYFRFLRLHNFAVISERYIVKSLLMSSLFRLFVCSYESTENFLQKLFSRLSSSSKYRTVNVDLNTASSRKTKKCATAPHKSALISASQPPARYSANTARLRIRADVSRGMPVYSQAFAGYSFQPAQRQAQVE